MQNSFYKSFLTLACVGSVCSMLGFTNFASAQTSTSTTTPGTSATTTTTDKSASLNVDKNDKEGETNFKGLSAEEVAKLKAARATAAKDPAVMAAAATKSSDKWAYRKAMRNAMLKADPSLAPIFEKMRANHPMRPGMMGEFKKLTPEEQMKLRTAHQQAMKDPSVIAAREQVKQAVGPAQKMQAKKAMEETVKSAMLKADPSVGPIIAKMHSDNAKNTMNK